MYDWRFDRLVQFYPAFLSGIYYTLELSLFVIVISTCIGVVVGVIIANMGALRYPVIILIDLVKSLPPLVLVLFGYFALAPDVVGITISAFWVFVWSISLNVTCFIADLTRAGVSNVGRDYTETAEALGLTRFQVYRFVVLPLAAREIIPPLSYLYLEAVKMTSLASVIAVHETVYVAQSIISSTARSLEVWVVVSLVYLIMLMPLLFIARFLERVFKKEVGIELATTL